MKVLAILQCQWVHNPERVSQIYARRATTPEYRADLNARFLFAGSLTGVRLRAIFGAKTCNEIIWEESSTQIAGKSAGVFPADRNHIKSIILHFKPDVVLAFGKIAADGLWATLELLHGTECDGFRVIKGPHPAARHATVPDELRDMAKRLREICPKLFG